MTWDFHERDAASKGGPRDIKTAEILLGYFGAPRDFVVDWSPRDRPFGHDLEVVVSGVRYRLEEKRRDKDFGDELLEDVSNDQTGRPGWTWRAGSVDFVLFTYPTGRWTIWPGIPLEAAWRAHRDEWCAQSGHKRAPNRGYNTLNVAVPTNILKLAVARFGAPPCMHCGNNVGAFRQVCNDCRGLSCCAVGDGRWLCGRCR